MFFIRAMEQIFSFGERWWSIQLGFASLNGTFHLSPHENICTIALINIHYLYNNDFWQWLLRVTLALSRAAFARKLKRTNNRAQCSPFLRTYHIAQWSSRLEWSQFVYKNEYRNDRKMPFLRVFVKKIHTKQTKLSK